jgi:DNA-binding NarL/FixJ family response regulator
MRGATVKQSKPAARIFVVDDHPIVREGLAAQIANDPGLELCGDAEDVAEAMTRIAASRPDVVIVDISLQTGNGIDLVKRLKAHDKAVRILVWSMYPENLYAERALRAGALGYIHKGKAAGKIIEAIRAVLAGKVYLSDEMSVKIVSRVFGDDGKQFGRSPLEALTDRELEAFELLGNGQTTQQIAQKMHVSPKTVETYRARIKEKLHLKNGTELIQHAVQWVVGKTSDE